MKKGAIGMVVLAAVVAMVAGFSAARAAGHDTVTLTLWDRHLLGEDPSSTLPHDKWFIVQVIQRFEKENPNIKIDLVESSPDIATADNQFRAESIARNGPDIASQFAGGDVISFARFAEPLDKYFPPAQRNQLKGWFAVHENFDQKAPVIALPYGAGSYFEIMYNKKLLRKAGIAPREPKTWQDFLAIAKKVKAKGVLPVYIGNQEGYTGAWVIAALAGGKLGERGFFGMLKGQPPIDSPPMLTAWDWYSRLFSMGLTNPDAGSKTNNEGQQGFLSGKSAFFIQGGWFNSEAYKALGADVGQWPIPQLAGSPLRHAMTGGPNVAIMVTNYSHHKPEAIKFLKFLARPKILDLYVKVKQTEPSNNIRANTAVIENPLLRSQAQMLKTRPEIYPFDNIFPAEVNALFYRVNGSVFTGRMSPKAAASQLQRTYDDIKRR